MIKKRLAAIALSIVLAVGLMPAVALAADGGGLVAGNALITQDATSYDLWVGGVEVTSANASSVTGGGISGKVSYDAATGTLTLSNATITGNDMTYQDGGGAYGQYARTYYYHGIRFDTGGDLVIRLVGKNEVRQTDGDAGDFRQVFGIMTSSDLTFTGSGSLSVVNDCTDENMGIDCGILTVDSGATVKVSSTAASYNSVGVSAGATTVKGSLDVSAHSGTQYGKAITTWKKLTVAKGGKLTAKVDHGNSGMDAIIVKGDPGTLVVNGYVEATSGEWAVTCDAIEVGSTGELEATGNDRAISPSTKVTLGSSKLKVMSWSEEISASKIGTHQNIHIYMPKDAQKKANPITVKAKKVTFKASKVKKKAQSVKASKAFTVKEARGKVTYKKTSGSKKLSISKAGKVTVKKGAKKGTYKAKVKVTAAGNSKYKSGSKTVTLAVRVK